MIEISKVRKIILLADEREDSYNSYHQKYYPNGTHLIFDDPHKNSSEFKEYQNLYKEVMEEIMSLSEDEVLDLMALMYIGQLRPVVPQIPEEYEDNYESYMEHLSEMEEFSGEQLFKMKRIHLASLKNKKRINADQICSKTPLANYLRRGIKYINEPSLYC